MTDADLNAPWPWDADAWKPTQDPIRQLVKAGALIAAEIDRRQRAGEVNGGDVGRAGNESSTTQKP